MNDPGIPYWKRGLDWACILLALPVLVPLVALIACAIKLSSPGPILFKQVRIGYRGRRFTCLKFRTMRTDADTSVHQRYARQLMASDTPMLKLDIKGDSRLIPLGSFLRSSGLDELPQLLNVLRGEMSLVGPRPCVPYEHEGYCAAHRERVENGPVLDGRWQVTGTSRMMVRPPSCLPFEIDEFCYLERCDTLPGMTGLWQVKGKNRTTFSEMMTLDVNYARNMSLWLDLKILFGTIPAVLSQVLDTRKRRRQHQQNAPDRQADDPLRRRALQEDLNKITGTQ